MTQETQLLSRIEQALGALDQTLNQIDDRIDETNRKLETVIGHLAELLQVQQS